MNTLTGFRSAMVRLAHAGSTDVSVLPLDPATDGWADAEEFHANIVCNGCGDFHSDVVLCEGCLDVRGCSCVITPASQLCGSDVDLCADCVPILSCTTGCPACSEDF